MNTRTVSKPAQCSGRHFDTGRVADIAKGDPIVLQSLYDQYSGLFYTIARRYFSDSSEAEDVVQEGFLQIHRKAHTFSFEGSFEGWMKRVVVNLCLSALKKKRILFDESVNDLENRSVVSTSDWTLERMNVEEIITAMQSLPNGCRAVMNLSVIDGLSHAQISAELGISESASRSQLTKARAKLRVILEKKELIER